MTGIVSGIETSLCIGKAYPAGRKCKPARGENIRAAAPVPAKSLLPVPEEAQSHPREQRESREQSRHPRFGDAVAGGPAIGCGMD